MSNHSLSEFREASDYDAAPNLGLPHGGQSAPALALALPKTPAHAIRSANPPKAETQTQSQNPANTVQRSGPLPVILSFDVEDHDQIEAAWGLQFEPALRKASQARLVPATEWILDQLASHSIRATFFIVGQVAEREPALIRKIDADGHELACHGWDHRRVHRFTPDEFREDLARNRGILEEITGKPVVGYRAPTFSIDNTSAWAVDILAEAGMRYDASIFPIRHDRYGVPHAPRDPFLVQGQERSLLELPPVTLRAGRVNLPVGGGGYFRLFPLLMLELALAQVRRSGPAAAGMLYFHPWEFDPNQPRLTLPGQRYFRTYVGLNRSRGRLTRLLSRHSFARAVDVANRLEPFIQAGRLPSFHLVSNAHIPGNSPDPSS